jgi:hypothetical protein
MNVTNNLKLPQYTEEDIFDLQDINKAYDSIDKAYKEVIDFKNEIPKTNATAEVIDARGGKGTLGDRLNAFDEQLEHNAEKISVLDNNISDIGTSYSNFENFSSMEDYIVSQIVNNGGANHDRGTVVIDIPAGVFEIKDFDILSKYARRTGGLKFRGRGNKITTIKFNPDGNDKYLFKNNDTWLSLRFEGITFQGNLNKNTNFMLSVSNGGAQNYVFTDCFFTNWNIGIDLKGTNNNSEFSFYSCNFNGIIKNFLYCGSDVGTGGDQFLNYNFFGCNYEVSEGNFINMYRGGNVNIWGGSFIHIDGDSENARGGTFFNFPLNTHPFGVERLLVIGARFELRNRNSKLIHCEWNKGNVSFINCDLDCYNMNTNSKDWEIATFTAYDTPTNIKFDNCSLMGKIRLRYNPNAPGVVTAINFDSCRHSLINNPEDVFVYDPIPSSGFYNFGKKPTVHIRNCYEWLDTTLNATTNVRALTSKKILFIHNINGSLPLRGGSETVKLPLGSIITKAVLYSPKGAVTSGYNANFTLNSGVEEVVNLATATGLYSGGFDVKEDLFLICDTDDKRTITLTDNASVDQTSEKSLCYIEYI